VAQVPACHRRSEPSADPTASKPPSGWNASAFTAGLSFTIDTSAPAVPTVLALANDPTGDNTPTITWTDQVQSGAATYTLQLSDTAGFDDTIGVVCELQVTTTSYGFQGGEPVWSYLVDTTVYDSLTAPAIGADGRLYVGASGGNDDSFVITRDGAMLQRTRTP